MHVFTNFNVHTTMETIYFNSPIGVLQLSGDEECITELLFVQTGVSANLHQPDLCSDAPQSVGLANCVKQLQNYFSGIDLSFNVPLRQHGTNFQLKVWNELRSIEPGKTLSYMQLSKNIGNVKAIRAVGTANGKNKIAIIVPCHRVIGSNGDLVGYAGDLWRKQWLLQHEAKYLNGVQTLF